MLKLAGQVAVVTGASKGIGAAIAEHLAAAGAAVVVNYASSKAGAEAVVGRIREAGGKAIAVQADVSKIDDIRRLFAETRQAFGKLDILINNAGIYEFMPLEAISAEHFHKQFDLNVLGPLLTTQEAVKHFGPSGGSIVNISSVAAAVAPPKTSVYSATKAAVNAITRVAGASWGRARSASTPSPPVWSTPRGCMPAASQAATSPRRPKRKRRSAATARPTISRRRWCSWPPRIPAGPRARRCISPGDCADPPGRGGSRTSNTKSESRNPKQIRISNQNLKQAAKF